jgi:UDP-N-acetyl-D-mannosaminuronate dehydrogenase
VDGVILQADHAEYKELSSKDFPGLKTIVDGRRTLTPENFIGVSFRVIGGPKD